MIRDLFGKLGSAGWRPFLGWGISAGLVFIVFAVGWRIANGTITLTELATLAAALLPLMQYIGLRTQEKCAPGAEVNPHMGPPPV